MKVQGEVEFGLIYSSSLDIIIKQCWDLSPIDLRRNRSDPYVKVDTSCVWISDVLGEMTSTRDEDKKQRCEYFVSNIFEVNI